MKLADKIKQFSGESPNSWADFWDVKKFPGPRALGAEVTFARNLPCSPTASPYKLYPIDVERAFRKLAEIKPHVKVWWKHGDQPIQLLSQGGGLDVPGVERPSSGGPG